MAGMHGLSAKIIESLPQLGGQLTALYPEKHVFDVAGFPAAAAADIAHQLEERAMRYGPAVHLGETVTGLEPLGDGSFRLTTGRKAHDTHGADRRGTRRVRAAPPAGRRRAGIRGSRCLLRAAAFQGRIVLVVGGGDTAVDLACEIAGHAARVLLVHRRDRFRAQGALHEVLQLGNFTVHTPYSSPRSAATSGCAGRRCATSTTAARRRWRSRRSSPASGSNAQVSAFKTWGIAFDGNAIPVDPSAMATNVPGVYAVGDIATYPGRLKLLALGFGEVGIAMANIRARVHPHLAVTLPHSSNLGGGESMPAVSR